MANIKIYVNILLKLIVESHKTSGFLSNTIESAMRKTVGRIVGEIEKGLCYSG